MLQVDAGVADQLVLGDPTAPRFVYWDKKLRPTPSGERVAALVAVSVGGCVGLQLQGRAAEL